MSEYVGAYAQRLAWLTGFGGSAGTAAVLPDAAAIFVDGRYTVQVQGQVDGSLYDYVGVPRSSVAEWLGRRVTAGQRKGEGGGGKERVRKCRYRGSPYH